MMMVSHGGAALNETRLMQRHDSPIKWKRRLAANGTAGQGDELDELDDDELDDEELDDDELDDDELDDDELDDELEDEEMMRR